MFLGLILFPSTIDACLIVVQSQIIGEKVLVDRNCFVIGQLIVIRVLYALLCGERICKRAGAEEDSLNEVTTCLAGILWE